MIIYAYYWLQQMPTKSWEDVVTGLKVVKCCFTSFNSCECFSGSQILA